MTAKDDLLYEISWKSYDGVMTSLKNLRALCGFVITADGFLLILFSNSLFFSSIITSKKVWIFQIIGICLSVFSIFLCLSAIHFSRGVTFNLSKFFPLIKDIPEDDLKSFFTEQVNSYTQINNDLYKKSTKHFGYGFFLLGFTVGGLAAVIISQVLPI
jgi:hypothetical protein